MHTNGSVLYNNRMDRTQINRHVARMLKAQGKDTAWSNYFKGGSYETATLHEGTYKVEFVKDSDSLQMTIWNPDKPCVVAYIHETDGASLDLLEYDPRCTVGKRMVRGSGTKEMLEFAFKLIKQQKQKTVQLTDASTFKCNGKNIRLGLYYFIKYGKTWYEQHFKFYPITYVEEYKEAKRLRDESKELEFWKTQPCDYFTDDVLLKIARELHLPPLPYIVWQKDL